MRSAQDLTGAALIRETAMRLFAERGSAAVTVRDIAGGAGVSPALVMHHYKSKDGLKAAVDARASVALADLLVEVIDPPEHALNAGSMAAAIAGRFADEPALPAYLRRLLIEGGEPANQLFRGLFEAAVDAMRKFAGSGAVRPAADDVVRTVFLLANDMAVLVLREQIAAVLGVDPLSADGMTRWNEAVLDVYTNGFLRAGEDTP